VWQRFLKFNGWPFLQSANNFAFMLNVDWFQPYKHVQHSVGCIFMVCLNLPREERFKVENVIVVGLMPGPHEPNEQTINHFLAPMVDELQQLWQGVSMFSFAAQFNVQVRAALLCVACDIPATRKVAGFVSHNATRGCNKCLKQCRGEGMHYFALSRF
jgi:hypothetical protein